MIKMYQLLLRQYYIAYRSIAISLVVTTEIFSATLKYVLIIN